LAQHIGLYSKLSAFCLEPSTPDRCNGSGFFFSMSYRKAFRLVIPYTTKVRNIFDITNLKQVFYVKITPKIKTLNCENI